MFTVKLCWYIKQTMNIALNFNFLCTGLLVHSLSWMNTRDHITNGRAHTKLWTPEDAHTAKLNGYYPADG